MSVARGTLLPGAALVFLSVVIVLGLQALRLPAALLLGPMAAAILIASRGLSFRIPRPAFVAAQALIGCMIARGMTPAIGRTVMQDWPLFLAVVLAVIGVSGVLGWLLTRWQVLPGTAAVWGSSPGGATAMTLMAAAYGADIRLVAFMQYLRVVSVAIAATLVARLWTTGSAAAVETLWFPPVDWPAFAATLAVAGIGGFLGPVLRIPAGALLLPMALGSVLHLGGWLVIELPPWLLAACYALVGWSIGLGFTPAILGHAMRALPRILASILVQIALCGGFAFLLTRFAGIEALTAYLATSPGGADSVAIIAASSHVDLPFVMALQTVRLVLVIVIGPHLARFIAGRSGMVDAAA